MRICLSAKQRLGHISSKYRVSEREREREPAELVWRARATGRPIDLPQLLQSWQTLRLSAFEVFVAIAWLPPLVSLSPPGSEAVIFVCSHLLHHLTHLQQAARTTAAASILLTYSTNFSHSSAVSLIARRTQK